LKLHTNHWKFVQ